MDSQHRTKLKEIDRFGDKNRINSNNFIATAHIFSEKFEHPFSYVFRFSNMFPEGRRFVAVPVTSSNNFISRN